MSSLKKPVKMTIHQLTMRMEVLIGLFTYLPMLKDSAMAVASIEKCNKPFNKAMFVGMSVVTCLIAWRDQYNLTHNTLPKSPRTMLLDQGTLRRFLL